jgi:hydrogenase assembly chaperone HypC/HupF
MSGRPAGAEGALTDEHRNPALGDERHDRALADEHCITCGDAGIAMRVLELDRDGARCAGRDGVAQSVAIDLVGAVAVGDELLVHAGVAISALGAPA